MITMLFGNKKSETPIFCFHFGRFPGFENTFAEHQSPGPSHPATSHQSPGPSRPNPVTSRRARGTQH